MNSSNDKTSTGANLTSYQSGLHEAPSEASLVQQSRRKFDPATSHSGLYDVSRMTSVSTLSNVEGAEVDRGTKTKTSFLRRLLVGIAFSLAAGCAYLLFADSFNSKNRKSSKGVPNSVSPRVSGSVSIPSVVAPENLTVIGTSETVAASEAVQHKKLKLVLDSAGKLISPFSIELDQNGDEIARTELSDPTIRLTPLPLGAFDGVGRLSEAQLPPAFLAQAWMRPFAFSEAERQRIMGLRVVAIEIKNYLNEVESLTATRLSRPLQVTGPDLTVEDAADLSAELSWLRAASLARDLLGVRLTERRLIESLLRIAKSYKPTGLALREKPLLDAIFAYDHVRHLLGAAEQSIIDGFFRGIVDQQFTQMKLEKRYGESHATHTLFAVSVGHVIQDAPIAYHGATQYAFHTANSKLLEQDNLDAEGVRVLNALLRAAYVLERSGSTAYSSQKLHSAADALLRTGAALPNPNLLETVGLAAYFRGELYAPLAEMTRDAGVANSRFGSGEIALLAATRRPTTSLMPVTAINRQPTNAPSKLQVKKK